MVTRHTDISTTGFSSRMQAETAEGQVDGTETLDYLAVQPRSDSQAIIGATPAEVNEKSYQIKFE